MKKWKIDPVTCLCVVVLIILFVAAIIMPGSGQSGSASAGDYEVFLPEGYDDSDEEYPVVYVLPQDGYAIDDSGIAEKLHEAMDNVIVVKVSFDKDEDVPAALKSTANEMDYSYRTIAKPDYRALVGTGTGGYLAYILGITESNMYKIMVSIRGDFVSEENPWNEKYGDVYGKVDWGNKDSFEKLYTYMDAPVDDKWTDMEGSTNDLGARFIKHGTSSSAHEFTVRPGEFTEEFLTESVNRVADRLTTRFFPENEASSEGQQESASASLEDIEGEVLVDLTSDWYFKYVGTKNVIDVKELTPEEYESWSVVQPGTGNWTKGYGNISEDNVSSFYGADYFDYFIVGSGYYVKTFDKPEGTDNAELKLAIGYVDDRCEVFLNGERIGATGMDLSGRSTGETTWAEYSEFQVDPELLAETNTVVVRAWNDEPYGAGGWYSGPIALYSTAGGNGETEEVSNEQLRFYEESFDSKYAASALGEEGTVENDYLIYLPEGYYESDRCYPTVYLLHQFNSNHNSYKTDNVDQLLDEGIATGAFDEMIVVIPNSEENSWWTGDWEKMITEELIPLIDSKYRTIDDARYRLTAGCSMGGQGAYGVALHNPEYFTGTISFFGAFSYGEENSPNTISVEESAEYMDYFSMYFICGNQDSYGFGVPAIELHQILLEKEVDHRFFIENGGHDSAFYVPYFNDAFGYIRGEMYQSDDTVESLITGELKVDGTSVKADVEALDGIEEYFNTIPESSYTEETEQGLNIPLIIEVIQDGEVVYEIVNRDFVVNEEMTSTTILVDIAENIDVSKDYTVEFKAAVFDKVVELGTVEK